MVCAATTRRHAVPHPLVGCHFARGRLGWRAGQGRKHGLGPGPSFHHRRSHVCFCRARAVVCCVVSIAALGALVLVPAAGAAKVGSTYLALGDWLTYGYHQAQFAKEYPNINPANYHEGYVDAFGNVLRKVTHPLTVINDGCPGETSETFINGAGPGLEAYCAGGPTGTPFPQVWLHHPYTSSSQLGDALNVLATNPNVSPITLDIGANDVLQFLEHTCGFPATYTCTEAQVKGEYEHIAANVGYILTKLRAAAPKAQIIVIGNYNPYPTVLPAPGGEQVARAPQRSACRRHCDNTRGD